MRNISDTIRRLRAHLPMPQGSVAKRADRLTDLPEFGTNPGMLRARIYTPANLADNAPLVVVLHGCTQSAAGYDQGSGWSALADLHGFAVLFPEQQRANNANLCFNWFVPEDIRRGLRRGAVDPPDGRGDGRRAWHRSQPHLRDRPFGRRRHGVGDACHLSRCIRRGRNHRGTAVRCRAATIPEAFDRMRGHGGPSDQALQTLLRGASSHDGPWPTISVWHGTADLTVNFSNADRIVAQWRGVHRLPEKPSHIEASSTHGLQVWRDTKGRALIEVHSIAGMGHGTPIDANAVEGGSAAGPFMLDVGISSTLEIARLWGIAPMAQADEAQARPAARIEIPNDRIQVAAMPRPPKQAYASLKGVGKVIEDALRAAGLMK